MEMNKFLKILWSINGVLIFVLLLAGGIALLVTILGNTNLEPSQPEIIVGEKFEEAKAEGLILQGLSYEQPLPILYTDHFLLPVSVRTYKNPKHEEKKLRWLSRGSSYEATAEYDNMINVVFLNSQLEAQSILLDKKGFILSFRYPSAERSYAYTPESNDTLQRCITYLITFEDSNKDGAIDGGDDPDLYLSDLDGGNLTRITHGVNVMHYYFLNRNQIMIKYERRNSEDKEYREAYLAVYSIKEKTLKDLSSLHDTLDKIESIIVK
jgi:hypothetical protein